MLARRIYEQTSGGSLIKLPRQWFRPDLISSWLVLLETLSLPQLCLSLSLVLDSPVTKQQHWQPTWFMSTFWLPSSHVATPLSSSLIEDTKRARNFHRNCISTRGNSSIFLIERTLKSPIHKNTWYKKYFFLSRSIAFSVNIRVVEFTHDTL